MSDLGFVNRYTGPLGGPVDYPYSLYNYRPNLGFNVFAAVVFALVMFAHIFWLAKYRRTRSVQALLTLFCAWELVVYAIRAYTSRNPFRPNLVNTQFVMNLTGPTWIIIAMLLALMAGLHYSADGSRSVFGQRKAIPYSLIALQIITFILLTIGSAMWSHGNATLLDGNVPRQNPASARRLTIAALAIQLTAFQGINTWILISLGRRDNTRTALDHDLNDRGAARITGTGRLSMAMMALLFLTVGMLWTRTIYRLAEVSQDYFGYAWSHESLFGVFEFALVWVPALVWAIRPFAHYIDDTAQRTTGIANDKVRTNGVGPGHTTATAAV